MWNPFQNTCIHNVRSKTHPKKSWKGWLNVKRPLFWRLPLWAEVKRVKSQKCLCFFILGVFQTAQSRDHKKQNNFYWYTWQKLLKLHRHFCLFILCLTSWKIKDKIRCTLILSLTSAGGGSEKRRKAISEPPACLEILSAVLACILLFVPGQNVEDVRNQDYWLV